MNYAGLERYLDSLDRETVYRVDEVLKQSARERTERVYLQVANGTESGPLIRKLIRRDSGIGQVYRSIYEAQRAGRRFKCLPQVMECYTRDEDVVVVMEHVVGETLAEYVYRCEPSVELAIEVFPALCDAVSELHEGFASPIIHRDLKPSNVIVCARQGASGAGSDASSTQVKPGFGVASCDVTLIDFGIAREFREDADADTTRFGTRAFAPPEQFGFGQTTPRSDVYALGMILYFCLTEEIPTPDVRDRRFADSRIPGSMREVIVQATAFDPASRFASARALKNAFLASAGVSTHRLAPDDGYGRHHEPRAESAQPASSSPFASAQAIPPASVKSGPVELVGRVWNVLVACATVAVCAYSAHYAIGLFQGQMQNLPIIMLTLFFTIPYFILVGFACLDKRRLRERFPRLARIKTWQIWVVVIMVHLVVIMLGRMTGRS